MPFYALSTLPLIDSLHDCDVNQVWYADDAAAVGKMGQLKNWWEQLASNGPKYGYFPSSQKSWLVTKEGNLERARELFGDIGINITTTGRPYLGSPVGTEEYVQEYMNGKVDGWIDEMGRLSEIGLSQPHAVFSALTHGLTSRWSFLCRTVPGAQMFMDRIEAVVQSTLLPVLLGGRRGSNIRKMVALPARLGGLGVRDCACIAPREYEVSKELCAPIVEQLISKECRYGYESECRQWEVKKKVASERKEKEEEDLKQVMESISEEEQWRLKLAGEKGASSWVTVLPIREFGFALHKRQFIDALCLRYGWDLKNIPLQGECGSKFSVEHALSCLKGGFVIGRHSEIRDFTASLLTEVCSEVAVEPSLQPVENKSAFPSTIVSENARMDIGMNGFWGGKFERCFVDVRVFNPHAQSNKSKEI